MSSPTQDFTATDREFAGLFAQRLKQSLAPDGQSFKLTPAGQLQLSRFVSELVHPRQREIAICALVQSAYVLDTSQGSAEASKQLLALANGLLPKQPS